MRAVRVRRRSGAWTVVAVVALSACAPAGPRAQGGLVPGPSSTTVTTGSATSTTAPASAEPTASWGRLSPAPVMFGRQVLVSDSAGHFVDVTPQHQPSEFVDDAFFVDHDRGWVAFTDSGAATARLLRTDDAGRTWVPVTAKTSRHQSAGSRVWLFFLDRRVGWTVSYAASAPAGGIYRTSDGGVTWSDYIALPEPGTVRFVSPQHGWLAGYSVYGDYGDLYETFDGGATWKQRTVSPPADASAEALEYRLPNFDGPHGVLPVSVGESRLSFYVTSDDGRTWHSASTIAASGGPKVSVAVASPTVWWAVDAAGGKIWVTSDGGLTWTSHRPEGLRGRIVQFEAKDELTAWASAFQRGGPLQLYGTTDGGQNWRPLP